MLDIVQEIIQLKREKNATILAHYYQEGEIQELADFTGDSLKLARAATAVDTATIVFCGVHFMAETAKMLNPAKRVLLPDLQAGCSLADSCPARKLARYQEMLRENGRHFQTVTYINSSAAVKALSDWVVTSGNAEEIIRRVPEAYRARQLRAVTLADYVKRAEELPEVSRAAARYAWTGSWRTVQVAIDLSLSAPECRRRVPPDGSGYLGSPPDLTKGNTAARRRVWHDLRRTSRSTPDWNGRGMGPAQGGRVPVRPRQ